MPYTNFYYDPARQGYDSSLWKTLSGTPATGIFFFADTDSSDVDIDMAFDALTITESQSFLRTLLVTPTAEAVSITENVAAVRT